MFDLKKATKEDLLNLLEQMAKLHEDYLRIYCDTAQGEVSVCSCPYIPFYADGSLFTGIPDFKIQVEEIFWDRLVEVLDPEIKFEGAVARDSIFDCRHFEHEFFGHVYKIVNLYTEKEI